MQRADVQFQYAFHDSLGWRHAKPPMHLKLGTLGMGCMHTKPAIASRLSIGVHQQYLFHKMEF